MLSEFQRDTSVERLGDDAPAGSEPSSGMSLRYRADVRPGWEIGEISNGGYLLALAGTAMADAVGRPPLTVTGHFLTPVRPGPAEVDIVVVRAGRRFATVRATLVRDGKPMLAVLGTFGVADDNAVRRVDGDPPQITTSSVPAARPARPDEPPFPSMNERLDVTLRPGDDGFRRNEPPGHAEIVGSFAFADGGPVDELALLLAADAFAPPIFNSGLAVAWVPTIELTVHVRAVPVVGPLRCVFRSRFITGGLLDEDGELWDDSGTLVAQSRQLSLYPRP